MVAIDKQLDRVLAKAIIFTGIRTRFILFFDPFIYIGLGKSSE
jgi:hypothetical protein